MGNLSPAEAPFTGTESATPEPQSPPEPTRQRSVVRDALGVLARRRNFVIDQRSQFRAAFLTSGVTGTVHSFCRATWPSQASRL